MGEVQDAKEIEEYATKEQRGTKQSVYKTGENEKSDGQRISSVGRARFEERATSRFPPPLPPQRPTCTLLLALRINRDEN